MRSVASRPGRSGPGAATSAFGAATIPAVVTAFLSIVTLAGAARAHEVSGPSARVVQRGRHLRIELRIDVAGLVARHAPVATGTQPPPVEILPALPEQAIVPMVEAASRVLRDEVRVSLDDETVAPERVVLPPAVEIQRLARLRAETGHAPAGEEAPAPVIVELLLPRASGRLAIAFGEEIGPLTASFARPEVRFLAPGEAMTVPPGCDTSR